MKVAIPLLHPGWSLTLAVGVLAVGVTTQNPTPNPKTTPEQRAYFETKIRPVLAGSCFGCHGKDLQLGGIRLDSREAILKGGDSGPAIIPGDPAKSLLIAAISQTGPLKMPKGGKLQASEVADFVAWVKMGAPWPEAEAVTRPQDAPLWSLKPVQRPAIPHVKLKGWVINPIDSFVLAKLEANGDKPSPPADRRTLLRRVSYDLVGLPPSAQEVDAFVADKSPHAYEKIVDRLLASPRYGERCARQWLDVARYADTKGYVFEEDRNYPNAYTYRDWVINAFNNDLPYDQFITQQLAADLIPTVKDGDDKRPLAALGFLNIGRRFLNSQPDIIDDRIDVTMRGFEGFTVGCTRCHDHKFDPIPTQDYYSLYAVFASSQEVTAPISDKPVRDPWIAHDKLVTGTEASIRNLIVAQVGRLRNLVRSPDGSRSLSSEVKQVLQALREEAVPDGENLVKLTKAFEPSERDKLGTLQSDLQNLKSHAPQTPEFAMAMTDSPNPSDGVVFKRGNPGNPGPAAPRRFLAALAKPGQRREHWTRGSGRLQLAQAIASPDNPLTARVFVNRLWQDHFGAAIVRTPSDFGHQGELPTHPELLDFLAKSFTDNGWSIKKLQRLMVTSATYSQSSSVTAAMGEHDPDNRLLGRMNRRRLDLEELRDSLMLAADRLDLQQTGGKSVDLWSKPFTERRAVYGFVERQNLPGIFRTFDFASPDSTNARRFQTTVPQQALFFMNSPIVVEDATALAGRPEIENSKNDGQRVRRMYRLLFDRLPDAAETAVGLAYLKKPALGAPPPAWLYGYGGLDSSSARVASFTPLNFFPGFGYRVSKAFPDPTLGYIVINGQGGHPGHDAMHSVIRRWIAPGNMTVNIDGTLSHAQEQGDGVRARIVSSRSGVLGVWPAHHSQAKIEVSRVKLMKGDTLDFIVDPLTNDAYDAFAWTPIIQSEDGKHTWDAATGFGPPPGPGLSKLALYAQALMMTNEFLFVD